ncbi:MAG TPA: signal peptidase I [Thermomicrobiales bacterium]|nr:signal peptidase I [Thermomicrobiales bacterium]
MDTETPDANPPSQHPITRGISEILKTVALAAVIFIIARALILPYEVDGSSMVPNLQNHERVLVNQTVYYHFDVNKLINLLPGEDRTTTHEIFPFHSPSRGDIVVLHPPVQTDKPYIKRVIGLPGETITFRNGSVFINGTKLDEPYLHNVPTYCFRSEFCDIGPIPAGYVFVLGDNRTNSSDSRYFGPVKIDDIVGKAWFTNWPLGTFGRLPHYKY